MLRIVRQTKSVPLQTLFDSSFNFAVPGIQNIVVPRFERSSMIVINFLICDGQHSVSLSISNLYSLNS